MDEMEDGVIDEPVVFLGCGKMGSALVRGIVSAGVVDPQRVWLHDVADRNDLAAELGVQVGVPNIAKSKVWVVAVKPHHVEDALKAAPIANGDTVVSVVAGLSSAKLRQMADMKAHIVRAMPNTPVMVRQGVTGVLADDAAKDLADALFGSVGEVVHLSEEDHFDALTAVSGCGPAYIFIALEALADGAVALGLPRDVALRLAIHTTLGAAALAAAEDVHPAELKDRVASPGGATIAGLAALERGGFRASLIDAVHAAARRSREMAGE